jgi:glycosyltransferase involved in cell wall biosynthesis
MSNKVLEQTNHAIAGVKKHGLLKILQFLVDLIKHHGFLIGLNKFSSKIFFSKKTAKLFAENALIEHTNKKSKIVQIAKLPASSATHFFKDFTLIIATLDLPQCKKYRVLQRAEMIEEVLGVKCVISHYQDIPRWRMLMQIATSVIFYRVPAGDFFDQAILEADRLGLKVSYDIDDPVFDLETVISNPNIRFLDKAIRVSLKQDAQLFSEAMLQCKTVTVSTTGMMSLVRKRFPDLNVYMVPNGLDRETLHYTSVAKAQTITTKNKAFSIAIPSGSHAHGADIGVALDGLVSFLKKFPETHVVEIGHGGIDGQIGNIKNYKKYTYLPYSEYLKFLPSVDCVLIPLADSSFNECKSIVRFLDASSVNVPVVATNIGEYRETIEKGVCIGVDSPDKWFEALVNAKEASEENDLGAEANKYVMENKSLLYLANNLDKALISQYKTVN